MKNKIEIFFIGISLLTGFVFINKTFTGNAIISNSISFNLIPIIGILLIISSILIVYYLLKK